jgi:hypothetical protein
MIIYRTLIIAFFLVFAYGFEEGRWTYGEGAAY